MDRGFSNHFTGKSPDPVEDRGLLRVGGGLAQAGHRQLDEPAQRV